MIRITSSFVVHNWDRSRSRLPSTSEKYSGCVSKYVAGGTSDSNVCTNPKYVTFPPCRASRLAALLFIRFRAAQSPSRQSAVNGSRYSSAGTWRTSSAGRTIEGESGIRLTSGVNHRQPR